MRISKCLALWALALLAVPTSVDAQGWKNPVVMSGQQSYDIVACIICIAARPQKACYAGHRATLLIGLMPLW